MENNSFMPKGVKGFQKGHTVPAKLRKIVSERQKGNTNRKGVVLSEETKRKISLNRKGIKDTEEAKERKRIANIKKWADGKMVPGMLGKTHSEETRIKMSKSSAGEKSHSWKGGITPENKAIRRSIEFRLWREAVFARDDWTCQNCKERGGKLHPHHIKPFYLFPELRFDVDNGVTLCVKCHMETDTWGKPKSIAC